MHSAMAILAAAVIGATPAGAQVLEIGDTGIVTTLNGPTITTSEGAKPLDGPAASAQQAMTAGSIGLVATPVAAVRMTPVGDLDALFRTASRESGVDARLLHAVAWQESHFRHASISPKGAVGIMQLMPDTARGLGVNPRDILQNLRGGAHLLARLLRQYRGNLDLTLAAYNAGPVAVRRWGGVPPYAETRDYVRSIRSMLPF